MQSAKTLAITHFLLKSYKTTRTKAKIIRTRFNGFGLFVFERYEGLVFQPLFLLVAVAVVGFFHGEDLSCNTVDYIFKILAVVADINQIASHAIDISKMHINAADLAFLDAQILQNNALGILCRQGAVLAAGSQLKNSFALTKGSFVYMSQFFGDMDTIENQNVYAHFIRKDIYNYWEKEEKKIYKEYVADYKKADPL